MGMAACGAQPRGRGGRGQRAPARQSRYRAAVADSFERMCFQESEIGSHNLPQSWHRGGVKGPQTLVPGRAATSGPLGAAAPGKSTELGLSR